MGRFVIDGAGGRCIVEAGQVYTARRLGGPCRRVRVVRLSRGAGMVKALCEEVTRSGRSKRRRKESPFPVYLTSDPRADKRGRAWVMPPWYALEGV